MNNLFLALSTGEIVLVSVLPAVFVLLVLAYLFLLPTFLWWKAFLSGAHIDYKSLILFKSRKANIEMIIKNYAYAKRENLPVSVLDIESHLAAGGNIENVLKSLVIARDAGLSLNFKTAKATDLSGRDILSVVRAAISPIMLETGEITATSKDGVELNMHGTVSLKTNMHRILGGLDEKTIMSRVVEGIVTTVGSAKSYDVVVENPDVISETVEGMGLDSASSYQIVSIDILSVQVGKNVLLRIQKEKEESEAAIKKAIAEQKIAESQVIEQQSKTKIAEMRAKLLEAEAEVPRAFAGALKEGKLGALDYYEMQNIAPSNNMQPNTNRIRTISSIDEPKIIRPVQNRIIRRPNPNGDTTGLPIE